jgi:hypothetical protein
MSDKIDIPEELQQAIYCHLIIGCSSIFLLTAVATDPYSIYNE